MRNHARANLFKLECVCLLLINTVMLTCLLFRSPSVGGGRALHADGSGKPISLMGK